MAADGLKSTEMTLSKLVLFADYYASINPSLSRFYMLEVEKLGRRIVNPPTSATRSWCPRCCTILRPETCRVSLNTCAENRRRKKRSRRRKPQSENANSKLQSETRVVYRCKICKHRLVTSCSREKLPKSFSSKTAPKVDRSNQSTTTQAKVNRLELPLTPRHAGKSQKLSVRSDEKSYRMPTPVLKSTSVTPHSSADQTTRKATNKKKDAKLKHSFLKSILAKERSAKDITTLDCLNQFFAPL